MFPIRPESQSLDQKNPDSVFVLKLVLSSKSIVRFTRIIKLVYIEYGLSKHCAHPALDNLMLCYEKNSIWDLSAFACLLEFCIS